MFPFSIRQRVRFGETDMAGGVYYANYLLYAEVGRMGYLRALGIDRDRDLLAHGVDLLIGEASVRYRAPLHFDEEFDVKVRLGEIRGSSFVLEYQVDRADGTRCAVISTIQVIIDVTTRRAAAIPPALRAVLEAAKLEPAGRGER